MMKQNVRREFGPKDMIVFNVNFLQQQDAFVKDINLVLKGSGGWGTSMKKDQKDQYSILDQIQKVLNTSGEKKKLKKKDKKRSQKK